VRTISRTVALEHFSYDVPTLAAAVALFGSRFQELGTSKSEVAPIALPELETFAGPLVWGMFDGPMVRGVWVDNVQTWIDTIPFSTDDGATNFSDVPDLQSSTWEFKQMAAILNVDGAAGPLESSRFDTTDALLRAEVEMLYGAMLTQLFAFTPKANGFTTLRQYAQAESKELDAGGECVSFRCISNLIGQLNKYVGRPEQYSVVLSPSAYAQFVQMMSSAGMNTMRQDEVTGYEHWFFDGIRVLSSTYLQEDSQSWGLIYRTHAAALPAGLQASIPPSQRQGVTLLTSKRGAVITRHEDDTSSDRVQNNVQVTAGAYCLKDMVATIVNWTL